MDCHLAVVEGLVRFNDPENSASGGMWASGRYNQAGKIKGEKPDQKAVNILTLYISRNQRHFTPAVNSVSGFCQVLLHMHCEVRFHVSCQHSSEAAKRASSWLQGFKCSFHHRFWSTFKVRRECKSGFKVYLVKGLISQGRSKNEVRNVQTVDRKILLLTKML